jgi:tetratricopeptide (TPR) repeat protein
MSKFKPTPDQLFASLKRCLAAKDQVGAERAAGELIEHAFQALDSEHDQQASSIAENLRSVDHPAGWEISALLLEHQEKVDEAVALLEDGVKKIPTSWRLWELLGNLYSDADKVDEALKAYDKALTCPEPDEASIRFHLAVAHARTEKFDEALGALEPIDFDEVEDDELRLSALAFKVSVLNSASRNAEAAALATEILEEAGEDDYTEDTIPHFAELHAQLARAVLEKDRDTKLALSHAHDAIHVDQGNDMALQIIRAITGKPSPSACLIQLTVKGTWPEPFEGETERREFRQTFAVIAETPEQALAFVRDISPEELRSAISVEQSETLQPTPDEPMGVAQASPYMFFADEDDEDGTP